MACALRRQRRNMPQNAAVLIDLESFFLGREAHSSEGDERQAFDLSPDLAQLNHVVEGLAEGLRIGLRRAYADFNVLRRPPSGHRDYFLQRLPSELMQLGIEPVQVFRVPGTPARTSVQLRMAMDATGMAAASQFRRFVLVTGETDLTPIVLELLALGVEVACVALHGGPRSLMRAYSDRFQYFEDAPLGEYVADTDSGLAAIRGALRGILAAQGPQRVSNLGSLIPGALDAELDPARFGCEDFGDFLQTYAEALGVNLREGPSGCEAHLAPVPADGADTERVYTMRPHSPDLYRRLLRQGTPHIYVPPAADWEPITEALHELADGDSPERPAILHRDLVEDASDRCHEAGIEDAARKVNGVAFILFKSGCFTCRDGSAQDGQTDFHWSRAAVLSKHVTDLAALRHTARLFVVRALRNRLRHGNYSDDVEEAILAEQLDGPNPTPEAVAAVRELIDEAAGRGE